MRRQDLNTLPAESFADQLEGLYHEALQCVAAERHQALVHKWLPRRDRDISDLSEEQLLCMGAEAVLLAGDLLVAQPSMSGSTAFDRMAKSRGRLPAEAAAIAALGRGRFRLLRVEAKIADKATPVLDACSGEIVYFPSGELPPLPAGTMFFGRVVLLEEPDVYCIPGTVTPLDGNAAVVARQHPAAGAKNAGSGARWAEAIYAHVVRHGTMNVPGLNRPLDWGGEESGVTPWHTALAEISTAWVALGGGAPDAALLQKTRERIDLYSIVEVVTGAVIARDIDKVAMADGMERMLFVQLETLHRRAASWSGGLTLDDVARVIDEGVAAQAWTAQVKTLFTTLRRRLTGGKLADDPALERLVQRIQALRSKTVAQGCTEQEALAAAEKVAELLDRHGLSLNELEFRAQPCEGIGIQTSRRRTAPIDSCIPVIAAFFDCRVWAERAEGAPLRYVFFGLRGDVAAAQFLYEMVERAFETETAAFRAGDLYFEMAGERRSASNSFQVGLARGISNKLLALRAARDAVARSASGRDLVPVKAAMVDEEMAKLGLNLSQRVVSAGRRVLSDAYAAGEAAGQRFEYAAAVTHAA